MPDNAVLAAELAARPAAMEQRSKLFASQFAALGQGQRLTVLDVGNAMSDTVEFFSQHKCRLYFADLFDESLIGRQQGASSEELLEWFESCLDFPADTRFDLCLFWDLFNFLDAPALLAFSTVLSRWLHAGTRAHGFGLQHRLVKYSHRRYAVEGPESFAVRLSEGPECETYAHPPAVLESLLRGFNIDRTLLLPDGRLEFALVAS